MTRPMSRTEPIGRVIERFEELCKSRLHLFLNLNCSDYGLRASKGRTFLCDNGANAHLNIYGSF
jgi:hypothetical protein